MTGRWTLAGLGLSVAILAVGVVGLAAARAGTFVYVTTHGTSMEPGWQQGDFVVVRPARTYQTGDVAAYYSRQRDRVVLHRIVDHHDHVFQFKGDNNSYVDPQHPRKDELIGIAWLRVPKIGMLHRAVDRPPAPPGALRAGGGRPRVAVAHGPWPVPAGWGSLVSRRCAHPALVRSACDL